MEIERKFLVKKLPENLDQYPHDRFEQGYLCTSPVVRVRKEGARYVLTYKGAGLLEREEYNLPLTKESYLHLIGKADGRIITKTRYRIPLRDGLTAELDIFSGDLKGLIVTEVEFPSRETALAFNPPEWFGKDVTMDGRYHNSRLSDPSLPLPPSDGDDAG
ncbi:MAG: CYTH domain-containing protein [Lachnospiraceae bacterium]|jgi:adenylate cyclase